MRVGRSKVKPLCMSVFNDLVDSSIGQTLQGGGAHSPCRISVVVDGDYLDGRRCDDSVAVRARQRGHEGIGASVAVLLKVRGGVASPEPGRPRSCFVDVGSV